MRLHDTLAGEVRELELQPVVTIYTCGITPYDATHVGHAFTFAAYDVLQRRLRDLGHETRLVRNVTDADDSLLERAREAGVHFLDLAASQTAVLTRDLRSLGLLPAHSEPRVSSALGEIRLLIGHALESGHAYEAGGAVYFDVARADGWGALSRLDGPAMAAASEESGADLRDPHKRDPLDFVLWQPSRPDEPRWESLWGSGRPGWHVGCSALVLRELGETVDIHGGGRDLVFPHHECERAQSEASNRAPLARYWIHTGLVHVDGRKMAKSAGNLVFVSELCESFEPAAVRTWLASHHYRQDWELDPAELRHSARRVETWRAGCDGPAAAVEEVRAALDADLDTPAALDALDRAASAGFSVSDAARLLGVELETSRAGEP